MDVNELLFALPAPLAVAAGVILLFNFYHVVVAVFGLKKQDEAPQIPAKARFAILVPARNEEMVVGPLCDSLRRMAYPKDLYQIIVAPNNCSDNTEAVAKEHGADIFKPHGRIASKGDVLTQMVDDILQKDEFDAVCVFDADNLVHPEFLQQMNNALANGTEVAQAFRDSKNPGDTAVSTAGSAWWWVLSRFINGGREALGLSAIINGSGFMVSCDMLRKMGGWHTKTMTEDYEFTALCVLQGQRVHYVPKAIIYDEQPLFFKETVKQRKRWCTGSTQSARLLLGRLLQKGAEQHSWVALDIALIYLMPLVLVPSFLVGAFGVMWLCYKVAILGMVQVLLFLFFTVAGFAFFALLGFTLLAAVLMKWTCGKVLPRCAAGLLFFPLYVLSWVPITIYSLFKEQTVWEPIAHTRGINMGQM